MWEYSKAPLLLAPHVPALFDARLVVQFTAIQFPCYQIYMGNDRIKLCDSTKLRIAGQVQKTGIAKILPIVSATYIRK